MGSGSVILTNKLGLPSTIVRAVANDPYVGGGDISVTKLIATPYQRKLMVENEDAITEDVADRIWALMGQIGHSIMERVDTDDAAVREERLYAKFLGWDVSGQFDLIEDGVLTDFKFTSVYAASKDKAEWEQQLNLLRLLCFLRADATGDQRYNVQKLQIVAILRDWRRKLVGTEGYPQSQVMVIPIKLWSIAEAIEFARERVALHQAADPPPCTDAERWKSPDVFALMKTGRQRAVKLYEDKPEADTALAAAGKGHWIETRPGSFLRCSSYCSVSTVCPVWQEQQNDTPF
jgi:hypothetical protein